jgi:HSP20 family protein
MALPIARHRDRRELDEPQTPSGVDVLSELERLSDDLQRLLEGAWPGCLRTMFAGSGFSPLADLEETDDAYVVEVELPGVKKGDISISVEGRRLMVDAERKERPRNGVLRRRARPTGHVHYEVVVPGDIDEDGISATLDDGVLTIRLGKPVSQRPRRIPVT